MRRIEFEVSGFPESQGVARAVSLPTGPRIFRKKKPWEQHFSLACEQHVQHPLWNGPCLLLVEFRMPRRGNLPKTKGVCHVVKPDASNMMKAVEDAIKGRIIRDDALLVAAVPAKRYARPDEGPGVRICLMEIDSPPKIVSIYYDGILFGEVNLSSLGKESNPRRAKEWHGQGELIALPPKNRTEEES